MPTRVTTIVVGLPSILVPMALSFGPPFLRGELQPLLGVNRYPTSAAAVARGPIMIASHA
ncbi:hypothetical protein [Nannocystis pusilla]|uniref:hypothetical protein n=1 Tax=Nannocystis pusilla TaxID=889268 RepID=UPI003DA5722E